MKRGQYKGSGGHETVEMWSILVVFGISRQASRSSSARGQGQGSRRNSKQVDPPLGASGWLVGG